MAVRYTVSKYQTDDAAIFKIRLANQTLAIAGNTPPAGAITDNNVEVKVSQAGNRRKFGLSPRGVRYKRSTGTGDDIKNYYTFAAALTPAAQTAMLAAASAVINGVTWTPYSKVNEE